MFNRAESHAYSRQINRWRVWHTKWRAVQSGGDVRTYTAHSVRGESSMGKGSKVEWGACKARENHDEGQGKARERRGKQNKKRKSEVTNCIRWSKKREDEAGRDRTRQEEAGRGSMRQCEAGRGSVRQDEAVWGRTRQGEAGQAEGRQARDSTAAPRLRNSPSDRPVASLIPLPHPFLLPSLFPQSLSFLFPFLFLCYTRIFL